MIGDILWTPARRLAGHDRARPVHELAARRAAAASSADFDELWRWSVTDLEGFWGGLWEFYGIRAARRTSACWPTGRCRARSGSRAPGSTTPSTWSGTEEDRDRVAVVARSQTRPPRELTFGELRELAGRVRAGLQRLGVRRGDRVVAYMPNIPETLAAFIATASLGAIWATCAPEFGARSVIGRFGADRAASADHRRRLRLPRPLHRPAAPRSQAIRGRTADARARRDRCPIRRGARSPTRSTGRTLTAESAPLEFEPVAFDHPLYVLFSSGTTGLPKAIVHGHGGQLIEHHKNQGLGWDLKPGGRLLWFSTTAWMMWNALVSALLLRSSIVMLDGDPAWPDLLEQWRLAEELQPTVMGVSPAYLMACRKAGMQPGRECDLREHPDAVHGRLAAAGRGLPVRLRAARPEDAAQQRLRRDRRVHRHGVRAASPSRCTRARSPGRAWASTRTRSTPRATKRRSASSASW